MKKNFINDKQKKYFSATKFSLKIFCIGIFFSVFVNSTQFFCLFFCNDFIFNIDNSSGNFFAFLRKNLLNDKVFDVARFYLILFTHTFIYIMNMFSCAFLFSILFNFVEIDKWKGICFEKHSTIINSVNSKKLSDKVALVVGVCNDFSPNQLLQTANQTYKNMDVWICDDSTNQTTINEIDDFVKKHKNFYVSRRDHEHKLQHPTKVGNTFYWLNKYGKKYDFVFENDSSSIVTSTFVENSLCYFHSPYLKNMKISGITCNANYYPAQNVFSTIGSFDCQIANEFLFQIFDIFGTKVFLDGWCSFYRVSTMSKVNLNDVECASCDWARGIWLHQKGYISIVNPFDFGGKISVQNINDYKAQRLKWLNSDLFLLFKSRLFVKKKNGPYLIFFLLNANLFPYSVFFILNLAFIVLCLCLNFFYFNIFAACLLLLLSFSQLFIFLLISFFQKNFLVLKIILWRLVTSFLGFSIFYKRVWEIFVNNVFKIKKKKWVVTSKNVIKTSIWKTFVFCIPDLIWLSIVLSLTILVTIYFGSWDTNNAYFFNSMNYIFNNWFIWTSFFPFFVLPSLLYISLAILGGIKNNKGWSSNLSYFPIEEYDFRYKFTKKMGLDRIKK